MPLRDNLIAEFETFSLTCETTERLMQRLCERVLEEVVRYNWIGFYLVDPSDSRTLVLGPHSGSFTAPHTRIPFDQGLCGAAASSGKTVIANDLDKDARVLRGSD